MRQCDWSGFGTSGAAVDGSTRIQGYRELFFSYFLVAAQLEDECDAMEVGIATLANAVDAGGPKGKEKQSGDWTKLEDFADVGFIRFSAV
jgi:hypothetical protein